MQFVDGVSATASGLRTLPMVAGMLITSIGSGAIVGRTGRYKIFPVAGTAIMALAFVLLSRMGVDTPTWLQSLYLFILGTGIGLCMQVLVLTVQNTAELLGSRRGHLGRHVLPDHRQFVRRGDLRFAVHQLPRRTHRRRPGGVGGTTGGRAIAEGPASAVARDGRAHRRRLLRFTGQGLPVRGTCRARRLRRLAVSQGGAVAPARRDLGDRPRRGLRHARRRVFREDARGGGRPDVPRLPGDPVAQPRPPNRAAGSTWRCCGR